MVKLYNIIDKIHLSIVQSSYYQSMKNYEVGN